MIEIALVIGLAITLVVKEYYAYRERHEMMDRLMARTLQEYKDNAVIDEPTKEDEPDNLVPVEDAREEILNGSDNE